MGYRHLLKERPESQDILQECTKQHVSDLAEVVSEVIHSADP